MTAAADPVVERAPTPAPARGPLFHPHDVRSLRDRAYDDIRKAILTGALKPGERIKERDVAAQMGISTTPVKEALRRLEQDGLVVSQPRRGAAVGPLVLTPPEEILAIRAHLEGLAAPFAAEKMGTTDKQSLPGGPHRPRGPQSRDRRRRAGRRSDQRVSSLDSRRGRQRLPRSIPRHPRAVRPHHSRAFHARPGRGQGRHPGASGHGRGDRGRRRGDRRTGHARTHPPGHRVQRAVVGWFGPENSEASSPAEVAPTGATGDAGADGPHVRKGHARNRPRTPSTGRRLRSWSG